MGGDDASVIERPALEPMRGGFGSTALPAGFVDRANDCIRRLRTGAADPEETFNDRDS